MSTKQDLLIEIGTEELPPKSLKRLASSFQEETEKLLQAEELNFSHVKWYASPRRLALIIKELDIAQEDKEQQRRGPALNAAFDTEGKPTKATEGFAKSCGVPVDQLEQLQTEKGSWLIFNTVVKGKQTSELIPSLIETALSRLPIAKRMRWGDNDVEFVRPIKWVLLLLGQETIQCDIMGITTGNVTYGHRFHHPDSIKIDTSNDYVEKLKQLGRVVVDFEERQNIIRTQVTKLAGEQNGNAVIDPDLLDEVTALVEWPISFVGEFNADFLKLPKEVLIATMQDNQKYFPVCNNQGELLPHFISVANIESKDPSQVKQGNERVIQPRLSDAAFFWERDLKKGLATNIETLDKVIYQQQLGTLKDKQQNLIAVVNYLTNRLDIESNAAKRAAELCLCDLLTEMVYEFPELQGTMGKYYAMAAGEPEEVAIAIEEFYLPRFSGDKLPASKEGQCLSIAEKTDSLVGIFAIGKAPTGDKDPFGLRRSAIGLLRIIIECELDINLQDLISATAQNFPAELGATGFIDEVFEFLMERLRRYYLDAGVSPDTFEAVLAINTTKPLDFHQRLLAVTEFRKLSEAESLAAANKRIGNILKKSNTKIESSIDNKLLSEEAEIKLATSLNDYEQKLAPMLDKRDYKSALSTLAGLREDVDRFFDSVMVMCEDEDIKNNRLALLNSMHTLFLQIADISKLQG